jgi:hypothetical protein
MARANLMSIDTNISYYMELSGSYIPPGYACQWKMLFAFDNDFNFKLYGKVIGKDILRENDFIDAFNMSLLYIPTSNFGLNG